MSSSTSKTTGQLGPGTTTLFAGRGALAGFLIQTDRVNNVTLVVYDSTTASGKIIAEVQVLAVEQSYGGIIFRSPVYVENGLTVVVSGTGAKVNIYTN